MRIPEIEARQPLGDDDGVAPVGREVHVVGILDCERSARLPVTGIDRRQAVADVVGDVERLQVVAGDDMLGQQPDPEVLDDLVRARIDHVDRRAVAVGNVDERAGKARCTRQSGRPVMGVHVSDRRNLAAGARPRGER